MNKEFKAELWSDKELLKINLVIFEYTKFQHVNIKNIYLIYALQKFIEKYFIYYCVKIMEHNYMALDICII